MTVRHAAEQAALVTTPVPVGVSGMTMFGITLQDWVFIGTAMLLVFQIVVPEDGTVSVFAETNAHIVSYRLKEAE